MAKTPKEPKPAPPTEPAESAVVDAGEAVDDLSEAGEEDFAELLATARERLENAEKEIKWLKNQLETSGKDSIRINSTLASLSSAVADLKAQTTEIAEKFQSLTRPPSESTSTEATAEPGTETPAIQAVQPPSEPPAVEPAAIKASPVALEPPARKKRFI